MMQKHWLLCLAYFFCTVFVFSGIVHAAAESAESGFVVIEITKDNVRLRGEPSAEGEIITELPAGTLLLVETWPIDDVTGKMSWFAVVGVLNDTKENIRTEITGNFWSPWYVNTSYTERTKREIPSNVYVQGYSAVNSSPKSQRSMAENHSIKEIVPAEGDGDQRIPVYAEPATSSTEINVGLTGWQCSQSGLIGVDGARPGWMLLVDLAGQLPSGWVESKHMSPQVYAYGSEAAYLVALTLGANVPEIMRRWGPSRVKRTVEERWSGFHANTELIFEGLEVIYTDYRNFAFRLTRRGAGIGGIFIGTDWCDKDYIEKTFGGQFTIEKQTRDGGTEGWAFSGGPDGWNFSFNLIFDANGQVQEFAFTCTDVNLS